MEAAYGRWSASPSAESIGSFGDLSGRVTPPPTQDEVGRLAVTFNDMLSRLQASDVQLRETLETQRRFVADASHELRTPLTTIRGNSGMLRSVAEMTPEDREEAMDEIHQEAERMSRLVGQLLVLARADAGLVLRREPVELAPLTREAATQVSRLAPGRWIGVEEISPVTVMGDSDALRQVLLILLDNAIKYTPTDGTITVRLREQRDEARVTVSDTGIGIEPEHLPHVFERFYRADPARTAGGTGLGLSIAQWIAGQHGGRIEAESSPGRGSVFTVHLPKVPLVADETQPSTHQAPERRTQPGESPA